MKQLTVIAIVLAFMLFSSCKDNKKEQKQETPKSKTEQADQKVAKKDCKDVHWSHHKGEDGPENWKNLCDGFVDCGGKAQSPIDIATKAVVKDDKLVAPKFRYGRSGVEIINNSHTVQFNVSGSNRVTLNAKEYTLQQFHYHALSEHKIDGKHYPLEVHFVHKHSDTDYAVLGVMFVEGKENALFTKYLSRFPTKKGTFKSDDKIELLGLLPKNRSYYNYKGSLTTPPCSEIVNWYVLKNPVEASKRQIKTFSEILDNNYRPVLPLNDRTVKLYAE